ncbi:hypothetical protein IMX12_34555 [Streptomyces sp. Babs14]|nr:MULTISPECIES: hypothetical protein [unclassified Streptomyces]MBU8553881.1 hypothetical protein [Streptomyces sp. Osf17]MBU8560677.1 hypothetical protein [Streptomyces sp. Babs14]
MSGQRDSTSGLTYSLATAPATPATGRPARLYLVVSNSGTVPVLCKQIVVVLPTGDLAQDLVPAGQHLLASVEPADQWTVDQLQDGVLLTLPQDETAAFPGSGTELKVVPANGESVSLTTHGLLVRVKDLRINARTGTALLRIRETVSVDNGNTWEDHQVTLSVAKYPPEEALTDDVVGNLAVHAVDTEGNPSATPVTLLKPGHRGKAVLTWTAPPDAVCEVHYDGREPARLSGREKWQLPVTDITRDTHFRVQVTLQRSGETITHHLTTAVAVAEPVIPRLTVDKITAGGQKNLLGHQLLTVDGAVVVEKESHFYGAVYGKEATLVVADALTTSQKLSAPEIHSDKLAVADKVLVGSTDYSGMAEGDLRVRNDLTAKRLAATDKALVGSTNYSGMADGDLWIKGKATAARAHISSVLGTPTKLTGAFDHTKRQAPSNGVLLLWIRTADAYATRTIFVDINTDGAWGGTYETVAAASIDYGKTPDVWMASATVPLYAGQWYKIWQAGEGGRTDAYFFPVLAG